MFAIRLTDWLSCDTRAGYPWINVPDLINLDLHWHGSSDSAKKKTFETIHVNYIRLLHLFKVQHHTGKIGCCVLARSLSLSVCVCFVELLFFVSRLFFFSFGDGCRNLPSASTISFWLSNFLQNHRSRYEFNENIHTQIQLQHRRAKHTELSANISRKCTAINFQPRKVPPFFVLSRMFFFFISVCLLISSYDFIAVRLVKHTIFVPLNREM